MSVFAAMLALVPTLAMVFLALGSMLGVASICLRNLMKRLHKRQQEAEGHMRSFIQECLESLIVIRAFGVGDKVQLSNRRNMEAHKKARLNRTNATNMGSVGISLVIQGGYVLGFAWCGLGILQGTVSYGTLMAVIQLINQIQSPFAQMGGVFSRYSAMIASAERVMELAEREEPKAQEKPAENCTLFPTDSAYASMRSICFEDVSFSYDQGCVLDSFSIEIPKGAFVAISGPSGIGKSTLMKLLLGVYRPDQGQICMRMADGDEIPVEQIPVGTFAYVPQGNHLMSGTIREVVGFAERDDSVDEDRLVEACRTACALDFVSELPDGFDSVLGERGAGLSEGQMQRLAVARALYSKAPILLLDEATSALDDQTERAMLESLKRLANHTVIVITHRPEALRICDMVVELGEDAHHG